MIALDTRHLYAESVGDQGIARNALAQLAPRLQTVHAQTIERMRGGFDAPYACLNLHETMPRECAAIETEAAKLRAFRDVIVIGIGGSNLGTMAVQQALAYGGRSRGGPTLHYVDNIDPDYLHDLLARLSPADTGVIAVSKSGGTLETATQYLVIREWLAQRLGADSQRHQWVVTDPKAGWLRALANQEKLATLPVPPNVGGRYSVLSAVGLLPLAVVGVDIRALREGARANAERCAGADAAANPALEMAAAFYALDTQKAKRLSILMPYVHALR
ncbi:MAG: glucose-6-phosphate isomerase, partial [Gammaproteobacteria bacterium]